MWSWNAPSGPPASSSCALGLVVHYASVALHYWSFWWNYTFSLWISAMPSYLQGMFFSSLFPKWFLYSSFKKTCSISLLTFLSPSCLEELFDASIWPCRYSIKAFLSLHYVCSFPIRWWVSWEEVPCFIHLCVPSLWYRTEQVLIKCLFNEWVNENMFSSIASTVV